MRVVHTLAVAVGVTTLSVSSTALEHRQRFESAAIAALAALTRVDHSTIFFDGHENSGYVVDGAVHAVALNIPPERRGLLCRGRAVSRDGARIAYVVPSVNHGGCTILIRDLRIEMDAWLAEVDESRGPLAWSWADDELAYVRQAGIYALAIGEGRERALAQLPIRVNGPDVAQVVSIDWLHKGPGILANAVICVPTGRPQGECRQTGHVLIIAPGDAHIVALGVGAAVSPQRDEIGFVTSTSVEVIDVNQPTARRITTVPFEWTWLRLFREETFWSRLVWSPAGDRFWFSTVLDEEFNGSYHLVDVKTRARRRLLTNTSLDITDWR